MVASAHTDDADWAAYYRRTAGRAPRPLVVDALAHLQGRPPHPTQPAESAAPLHAVDLGCGDGTETLHLLQAGLTVTAMDREPAAVETVDARADEAGLADGLTTMRADLASADVPPADLLVACLSLPFLPPEDLDALWRRMLAALRPGGIVAVQLFGDRDSWASGDGPVEGMTFHRREDLEALLDGLTVLQQEEHEFDGPSGRGPKHWHRFDVIARR